jgi:ABC-type branched-subunit amino acid transport system ATPase component/branched-subunit amino acid ABC-type transport system permease component
LALALSTLALAFACSDILFQLSWLGNGLNGWTMSQPKVGPFDLADTKTMAALALILVLATVLLTYNLQRSTAGRQMLAVRNSPAGAASIGVSPTMTKLKLFALSAAIAAVGGVLLATSQVNISTGATGSLPSPVVGLLWLAIVVVFGVRRPSAAIIGGLIYSIFPALLSSGFTLPFGLASWAGTQATEIPTILFGLGAVFLARQPNGSMQDISRRLFERRERKRQQGLAAGVPEAGEIAPEVGETVGGSNEIVVATPQPVSVVARAATAATACGSGAAIHVDDMSTGYGEVTIIRGLTLTLKPGTVTVLLGANGAGKSTTCQAIAGLLPITAGRIYLEGLDITDRPSWWRSLNGIYLAPEGRGIFPSLSVDDNLKLTLQNAAERSEVYERFSNLMARQNIPAGNLSGGEQQMLALAPALVQRPDIVISDEPTLGLAPRVAEQILRFFDELRTEGSTVLIAGESPRDLLEVADAVTLLHGGRVAWSGDKSDLPTDAIETAYFGDSEALSVT